MSTHPSIPTLPYPDHRLPPALEGLSRLAYNMYWSWHPEVRELFTRIDRQVWLGFRSPVAVLQASRDWTSFLEDPDFMVSYRNILAAFDSYMENGRDHWFARRHADELEGPVAYFCAEYGLQEALPIYSGGAISSKVKQAQYNFVFASEQLEKTFRSVQSSIYSLYNNVNASIGRVRAYQQSVVSAESALSDDSFPTRLLQSDDHHVGLFLQFSQLESNQVTPFWNRDFSQRPLHTINFCKVVHGVLAGNSLDFFRRKNKSPGDNEISDASGD